MNLDEFMEEAGISKTDLTAFISPIVKETIVNELGNIIQDVVRQEIRPTIETIPGLVNSYVTQQIKGVSDEIKNKADEWLNKVIETTGGKPVDSTQKGKSEISEATKERIFTRLIDKALGADEDELLKIGEKLQKRQQAMATMAASLGYAPPDPGLIWKSYQDATSKLYASMLKSGGFPFPVVDDTKKKVSSSAPQSESSGDSSKRVFDKFLR